MMVATTPDGVRFYSNDAQLFSDGEVTIYSPQWLPAESALSSTELGVTLTYRRSAVSVQVTDMASGYVFLSREGLTVAEALDLAEQSLDKYSAKEN